MATANRLAIHALHDAGFQLHVYALSESPQAAGRYMRFAGLKWHAFANRKIPFAWAIWRALLVRRYSTILCDHVNLAVVLAPLARLRLINYTVFLHGIEVFPPLPDREGLLGLHSASRRLAVSDHTRSQVLNRFPTLQIVTCNHSLSPDQHISEIDTARRTNLTLSDINGANQSLGEQVILQVGRMSASEQYKGQDTLIKAMPHILTSHPKAQLVLVGRGDDAPRLKTLAQAQSAHAQSAIFMPGFVPDEALEHIYANCYLFAMPSRGEGFGLVYIEAMRWGKPCIGSRADAARCVIQDTITGLLVDDPTNPIEVAEKVITLLDQPEKAMQMGRAGRQRVRDHFTYEQFKVRFLKALDL